MCVSHVTSRQWSKCHFCRYTKSPKINVSYSFACRITINHHHSRKFHNLSHHICDVHDLIRCVIQKCACTWLGNITTDTHRTNQQNATWRNLSNHTATNHNRADRYMILVCYLFVVSVCAVSSRQLWPKYKHPHAKYDVCVLWHVRHCNITTTSCDHQWMTHTISHSVVNHDK